MPRVRIRRRERSEEPIGERALASREQRIHATVDSIPVGQVATYGQIAAEAGLPRRARLVGRTLRELPSGSLVPWHRVLGADGRILVGGASALEQRRRLQREGVRFGASGRVDLARYGWRGESTSSARAERASPNRSEAAKSARANAARRTSVDQASIAAW